MKAFTQADSIRTLSLFHSHTHTHTQMGTHMKYIGTRSVQGKLAKTSALRSKNEYDTTQSRALAGGACKVWKGSMAKKSVLWEKNVDTGKDTF